MPVHVPPLSRRQFLAGGLAAGAALSAPGWLSAATKPAEEDLFLLLADIHIPEHPEKAHRSVRSSDGLKQAIAQALTLDKRPHTAIVSGDCAFRTGEAADYRALSGLIAPLREGGMPTHFSLGNHDHRQHFLDAFPDAQAADAAQKLVAQKHVAVIETPQANWFLLDSLNRTNHTPGLLGPSQLAWLSRALDARPNKPAIVLAHHNPDPLLKTVGLIDTTALFQILEPRKQVKAYVFGHTHRWETAVLDGIHLINVPTTAWLFDLAQPRGFLTTRLLADRAVVTLHALDAKHAKHGQTVELKWRG